MALPVSGTITLQQIYDEAVNGGYVGAKSLKDLSLWTGWDSPSPSLGTAPYAMTEFYGLETESVYTNITLKIDIINNYGSTLLFEERTTSVELGSIDWEIFADCIIFKSDGSVRESSIDYKIIGSILNGETESVTFTFTHLLNASSDDIFFGVKGSLSSSNEPISDGDFYSPTPFVGDDSFGYFSIDGPPAGPGFSGALTNVDHSSNLQADDYYAANFFNVPNHVSSLNNYGSTLSPYELIINP